MKAVIHCILSLQRLLRRIKAGHREVTWLLPQGHIVAGVSWLIQMVSLFDSLLEFWHFVSSNCFLIAILEDNVMFSNRIKI